MRGGRKPFFRRQKSCPFSSPDAPKIDFKDVKLLQKQRELARAIKRARNLALLPFVIE